MVASVRLPRLQATVPIVDDAKLPTQTFQRQQQQFAEQIETVLNAVLAIPEIQQALADLDSATQAAKDAAVAAQQAADDAQTSAQVNAATAREQALASSGIDPSSVLSYDGALIQIAAHKRVYGDGTSVDVNAGSIGPAGTGTRYISYVDPERDGGAVTYQRTTTNPTQTGDTHVVGAINVPATGTASGGRGPSKPGGVQP